MQKLLFLSALWRAVHAATINSTTCDANCQALAKTGIEYETSAHAVPNDPFYTAPSNFSRTLAPGSLLKIEYATDLSNYLVPNSLTMSRIMYTTTDLNGTVLPVSAYILWPYTSITPSNKPGSAQFPLVAWAHGTTGNFAACGPSNYKALQYHFMVPYAIAEQGIAVVAPDYAGLGVGFLPDGTPIPHAYAAPPAQANDLANAVIAARAAFPANFLASGPFVAAGHSQGGAISWAFAERQTAKPLAGYKGTLAFAPFLNPVKWIEKALVSLANGDLANTGPLGVEANVISGVTAVYPAYNDSGMTPVTYDRWNNVITPQQACNPAGSLILSDIPQADLARPTWTKDKPAVDFVNRTVPGGKKFAGPLLVIAGEQDSLVTLQNLQPIYNDTCAFLAQTHSSEVLELVTFPKMNHFPVILASQSLWMEWIKDRLLGSSAPRAKKDTTSFGSKGPNCSQRSVNGFRTDLVAQGQNAIFPNWLVTGVPPSEAWKLLL
ncbi:Alpha/Beta hydrolase protein [Podospora didyma]|uniref:Alpha/Beta hydrolase protein n=1 Tax=Podospora didyma TaxID=330526 RepID=A0AAE0K1E8_9PEZI|nr:Alpha/Beta hydrolase protein [Podospora didyma]